jgi:hypothetical protein
MKIASRPFCLALLPACLPTTIKIRNSGKTLLQLHGSPRPPAPSGVAGAKVSVSEPGIFAHVKTPCSSFKINACVSVDPKKLEVLQNQRLQKIGGEGGGIVNRQPAESSAAPSLAVLRCSEASPMAAAIGSLLPVYPLLLHSSNSFVSLLDAMLTRNEGGGGWQELQFVSRSSATPNIPVLTSRRSGFATFVSRTTHYSLFTTHWSFPCA